MNALQGKSAFEHQHENHDSEHPQPAATETRAPHRGRLRWLIILSLLLAGGAVVYQSRLAPAPEAAVGGMQVDQETTMRLNGAETMTVEPVSVRETVRVSGSLVPARQATISARGSGTVETVNMRPGDAVAQGEVIAELDTQELQSQQSQQASAIAATRAQLRLAESQLESTRSLVERGSSPRSALDSAQSNVDGLVANLEAQQAQLDSIDLNLANATIRAPFNGVIATREVDQGQTINAGTPVATLVDLGQMEVRATASLSQVANIAVGQRVELSVDGIEERVFEATVDRISPVANEGTRSLPVFLRLDNSDLSLRGGMFVTGEVIVSEENEAIAVPASAVRDLQDTPHLLVVSDGHLERRDINIARHWNGGRLVELSEGVAAGETIISVSLPELEPGMSVALEG